MEQYSFVLNLAVLTVNLLMMVSVGLSLDPGRFVALARIKFAVLGLLTAQTLLLPGIGWWWLACCLCRRMSKRAFC